MHKKLWNKDYILLLQGRFVSTIGDLMYSVAIGYWVYQQTGSNALMGIMSSISMFVTMFLSPVCGSIVDKCNRKWLIVGIDVMQHGDDPPSLFDGMMVSGVAIITVEQVDVALVILREALHPEGFHGR